MVAKDLLSHFLLILTGSLPLKTTVKATTYHGFTLNLTSPQALRIITISKKRDIFQDKGPVSIIKLKVMMEKYFQTLKDFQADGTQQVSILRCIPMFF